MCIYVHCTLHEPITLHSGQAGHAEEVIFYDEKGNCCESTKAIYMNYSIYPYDHDNCMTSYQLTERLVT